MDEVFRLEGVGFSYAGRPALKGVGFAVRQGDSLAVLGANGSGKSTLLKILDGLVFPEAGSVTFAGQPLVEAALQGAFQRSFRSRVGFVFAEPDSQLFCPTVREELSFGPLQLGMKPQDVQKRVSELLEMLGITALGDRAPYTLSGGEKKKAAIGAVLAVNPEVLLLDEPTNGLDPRTQVWLYELLEALKGAGKTIIMATHDLSLVQDLSDRAIVLGEDHSIAADRPALEALRDKDLLLRANIIHEHAHRHGDIIHRHSHGPYSIHDEHD
ncbi:MAG: ABC transporter ATP-binding protein [Deltaproteobacteria bacterium]|nr:ABC transporter ATP-binding protein [Deltaproteobacteria bacterium]